LASDGHGYCVECGAELDAAHQFCWRCGAQRWSPPEPPSPAAPGASGAGGAPSSPPPPVRPPPSPGAPARSGLAPAAAAADLGLLPWLYAAGAVFFLVWATQALALLLAPSGRAQLLNEMGRQGVPANAQATVLAVYGAFLIGAALAGAGLHAGAFYGLRRRRWWGWLAAVIVAGFWSLLIVGLPVLLRLVSRNVRQAFGME
jgi:hypothetical protein